MSNVPYQKVVEAIELTPRLLSVLTDVSYAEAKTVLDLTGVKTIGEFLRLKGALPWAVSDRLGYVQAGTVEAMDARTVVFTFTDVNKTRKVLVAPDRIAFLHNLRGEWIPKETYSLDGHLMSKGHVNYHQSFLKTEYLLEDIPVCGNVTNIKDDQGRIIKTQFSTKGPANVNIRDQEDIIRDIVEVTLPEDLFGVDVDKLTDLLVSRFMEKLAPNTEGEITYSYNDTAKSSWGDSANSTVSAYIAKENAGFMQTRVDTWEGDYLVSRQRGNKVMDVSYCLIANANGDLTLAIDRIDRDKKAYRYVVSEEDGKCTVEMFSPQGLALVSYSYRPKDIKKQVFSHGETGIKTLNELGAKMIGGKVGDKVTVITPQDSMSSDFVEWTRALAEPCTTHPKGLIPCHLKEDKPQRYEMNTMNDVVFLTKDMFQ